MEQQQQKWELTPEQKAYKQSKDQFRKIIAGLVTAQKTEKGQRNTRNGRTQSDMTRAQQASGVLRNELNHYYLAYAIMRYNYGGYTKLKKILPEFEPLMLIAEIKRPDINPAYILKIMEKNGPETVHLNP